MKQSKKQRKVGKVMREFKSGTLKSGGSGKKVTNPKQAIAIALSEANAMNQGGMMQNPVMQRPMFQTPMQRESMGIMAGVAPIQGYAEGGEVVDGTEQEGEGLFNEIISKASELGDDAIKYAQENPVEAALMFIPGLGAAGLAVRFGPRLVKGMMTAARKSKKPQADDALDVSISPGSAYRVSGGRAVDAAADAAPKAPGAIRRIGGRMGAAGTAGLAAARRNPGKTGLGALAAAGLATIPFGGKEEETEAVETPVATQQTGGTGGGSTTTEEPGFFKRALETVSDPRLQYQLAKAGQATEGRVPRNFFSDMVLAGEEYDLLQAEKDDTTSLQSNLAALQELMPDAKPEELINLLLGTDTSSDLVETRLTLFNDLKKDPSKLYVEEDGEPRLKTNQELFAEADEQARLALGMTPITATTSEIPLQQPTS